MFGILRVIAEFATTPSNFLFLLSAVGLIGLIMQFRRFALFCIGLSVTGTLVFGYTSTSELLIAPLVTRFPAVDTAHASPPFGIIVFGGGMNESHASHFGAAMELVDGGEAIPTTALLARQFPEARIVLSGGNGGSFPLAPFRETDGMRRLLIEFGVAEGRIIVDSSSKTTYERVINTLALIGEDRDKNWWVVTPAHRMPRVIGTYRRDGFAPVAFPIDFRWIPPFDPRYTYALLDGLGMTDTAMHEWVGLLSYRWTGKIDSFFPSAD